MAKFVIACASDVGLLSQKLYAHDYSRPLSIEVKRYRAKRSMSQNSLFHAWVGLIARKFDSPKDYTKLKLKRTFGVVDHERDFLTGALNAWPRSTTKYTTEEMAIMLSKVEVWAIDNGISLPLMGCEEYESYREASR